MKRVIILFYFITFFISCSDKKNEINVDKTTSPSEIFLDKFRDEELKNDLKNKIHNGDTLAYNDLKEIYYLTGNKKDFLFYSVLMVDNYEYLDAYKDCYYLLKNNNSDNNNFNNRLADYYLLLGYEKNRDYFKEIVEKRFESKNELPSSANILCDY